MTQKISYTDRNTGLSLVRIVACVGIVILHTVFAANEYFAEEITGTQNLFSRMVENNMMWAVPCFLMVTGALQLDPARTITMKKLYGRYILRILIALVACCIVFRIFDMCMDGEAFTPGGVAKAFTELITARCWGHLWYLYLLIGIYVLLPFYRMISRHSTNRELMYLIAVYVLFVSIIPMVDSSGTHIGFYISESIIYPAYLFLGYMITAGRTYLPTKMAWVMFVAGTAAIVIMDVCRYSEGIGIPDAWFGYASPAVIIQTVGVFAILSRVGVEGTGSAKAIASVDGCTFGIYLIHMVFIRTIFRYMQIDPYEHVAVLSLAAAVAGIFIISFLITWILKRIPGVRWVL